ncbi:hypothetical protein CIHG_10091 [Coccidioides immitis H538.4]|uniref:Uncharacterized protein n=1 Tax=Coccidioides immitis H538.4 TaxID=396776 RepID=A0A0J8S7G6_COCIT|nr:hypothetical protein CIHG_10091 [Coccidioides immitis H538.4]
MAFPVFSLLLKSTLLELSKTRIATYPHGTSGTLASGRRPDHYRVLSGNPNKLPTFGYRGYGLSDGSPSEEGLLCNAIAIAEWIMHVAGNPTFLHHAFWAVIGNCCGCIFRKALRL